MDPDPRHSLTRCDLSDNSSSPTAFVRRSWYSADITVFLNTADDIVLAQLVREATFSVLETQRDAWLSELTILRAALNNCSGRIYLEFTIPRMGHRADAVVLVQGRVLVIEFKIGAKAYTSDAMDQACDYAMDLKYFHEGSHNLPVVPILVATDAPPRPFVLLPNKRVIELYDTVCSNRVNLPDTIAHLLGVLPITAMNPHIWESSRYHPTPKIVEAARALYAGHAVADISRSDASAINLSDTSYELSRIIEHMKDVRQKAICFVTGVPGAGKTLVGLNMATQYNEPDNELHSVFLSGNGPLVMILREVLARDSVRRSSVQGSRLKKSEALTRVKSFIQNVHHFRDECLTDDTRPPIDHVAIFDEAQRAWNHEQTATFMRRKRGIPHFQMSEPQFLISCMDRRKDWAVIVCLVGGGQEINTGEAGIGEWIEAIQSFGDWHTYISPALTDSEYGVKNILSSIEGKHNIHYSEKLHLSVSVRSFRAEKVSAFVKTLLDCETNKTQAIFKEINEQYPIALTRNLECAKRWLRGKASGSERYGIIVSSQAERLKPYALDVRTPVNPIKWFLDGKDDVRSSYYLEDVATEFHVQGLELDWACVSWDGDFRYSPGGWQHFSFRGTKWQHIKKSDRKSFQKNAYRVLLTRARQGMVIFVPEGSTDDPTRLPDFYNSTFHYLSSVGIPVL